MSITFAELRTEVSEALRDPDGKTFDASAVGRMVNMGITEIGRLAPEQFREEIDLTADVMDYVLRSDEFSGEAVPEIEVTRVEVWDGSQTPPVQKGIINPVSREYINSSDVGYTVWGGTLYLPTSFHNLVDGHEDDYILRVYGYSPYPQLSADGDVASISSELQWALVTFCEMVGLKRLDADRNLYTQWQTRSGNSDVSPAGLLSALNSAREEWRRISHAIYRQRAGS